MGRRPPDSAWLLLIACAQQPPAIAAYLDGWVPLRAVAEHVEGSRCWLWIKPRRTVAAAAADD